MPLTTSDQQFDPSKGGTGRSKHLCWECNKYDKHYTLHPAYRHRLCRSCCARLGIPTSPIEVVEEENDGS